jgi:hypothetical protein
MAAPSDLPARLLRGFFRLDDPLLVGRYNEALAAIGIPASERTSFHVDAAGYSPEIAADLGDPLHLCHGVLRAHAVIVAVEQLRAPLVHPGLGFAAEAYRRVAGAARREIARITLREPLIAEARDPDAHLTAPRQLADLSRFELRFRTPGGLLRGVQRLEALKEEFLRSERRWLDDEFIRDMADLARAVRDLGEMPDEFTASSHPLGPFYTAAFGGSYVLEEAGASARSATTYVLCSDLSGKEDRKRRSARGRKLALGLLEAGAAAGLLERHRVARLDAAALRSQPEILEGIAHWIAVDHLLSRDPEAAIGGLSPHRVVERMLELGDPPPDYVELAEVGRRVRSGRSKLDPDEMSALLRMRLLVPSSTRKPVRRFACHLRAFVDPVHLERAWRDAPDVFFARLPALSPTRRAYFASWLEAGSDR